MTVKPIRDALVDEHVVSVYPNLQPFVDETWQRRLNLYTGRSLSAEALQQEQTVRAGRLAHRGHMLSPGVVTGLEVIVGDPIPTNPLDSVLYLSAGMGLTARGEDVVLPTPWEVNLGELQLYLPEDRLVNRLKIAIQHLFLRSQTSQPLQQTAVTLPPSTAFSLLDGLPPEKDYKYNPETHVLSVLGPMTEAERLLLLPHPTSGKLAQRVLTEATWRQQYEQRQTFEAAIAQLFQNSQASQPDTRQAITLPTTLAFTLPSNLPPGKYTFNANTGELTIIGPMTTVEHDLLLTGYTAADLNANLPRAGILVLQPVTYTVRGNPDPSDPCDEDPTNDAYEDQQLVDGCRLLLYLYPDEWLPLPERDERWRNRLAYSIFWADRNNEPDQVMPWENIGVPIALIGFDDNWKPAFVDSHAVVRVGGLPKRRHKLLREAGSPFLWHARIQQFAEQLAEMDLPNLPPDQLHPSFRYLPPVGVLPKNAIQPRQGQNFFFPARLTVQAVPIPLEQLDLVVQESASLVPFDLFNSDLVQVLVPVPQTWYEPRLLINEQVSPEFAQQIRRLIQQRKDWLQQREVARQKALAIAKIKTGRLIEYPYPDPDALADEPRQRQGWFSNRVWQSTVTEGGAQLFFRGATDKLAINPSDILTFYVYLDPYSPPTSFEVWWIIDNSVVRKALWTRRSVDIDPAASRWYPLPEVGRWVRIEVPAKNLLLENAKLYGMAILVPTGQMAWGYAGKARPGESPLNDTIWIGDLLPRGTEFIRQIGWDWKYVDLRYAEVEPTRDDIPFGSPRILVSNIAKEGSVYSFKNATNRLSALATDRLIAYVYLDPTNSPDRIELWWITENPRKRFYRAYWSNSLEPGSTSFNEIDLSRDRATPKFIGDLPESGRWIRLQVPASPLAGEAISGMAFVVYGGRAAWAQVGKSAANQPPDNDTVWIGTQLPAGASVINQQNWQWIQLDPQVDPFGEALPIIVQIEENDQLTSNGKAPVQFLEQLRLDLQRSTPLVQDTAALPQTAVLNLPNTLKGRFSFDSNRKILTLVGVMISDDKDSLFKLIDDTADEFKKAIERMFSETQNNPPTRRDQVGIPAPNNFFLSTDLQQIQIEDGKTKFEFDPTTQVFSIWGAMTNDERQLIVKQIDLTTNALKVPIGRLYEYSQDNDDVFTQLQQIGIEGLLQDLNAKVNQLDDKIDFGFLRVQTNTYRLRQFVLGTAKAGQLAVSPALAQIAKTESSYATQQQLSNIFKILQDNPEQSLETLARAALPQQPTVKLTPTTTGKVVTTNLKVTEGKKLDVQGTDAKISAIKTTDFEKVQSVQQQQPIIGKVPRTVSIAERLKQPRSSETRDLALATKRDIVAELASISILKDLSISGVEEVTFGQLKIPEERNRVLNNILQGIYDPLPTGRSDQENSSVEAVYFAAASKTLDDTVAILRVAEGRVQEYRAAIALCQNTLEQLIGLEAKVNDRLQVIGTELGETRHDLSVARALLAEEEKRVAAINDRRDRIVNENVPFLVFHRPRIVNTLIQGPTRLLNPATDLLDDPVPTCLRQRVFVPPQLGTMVDLLKDAPLSWFIHLPLLLDRLDRLETLQSVVTVAVGRAKFPLAATQMMQAIAPTPGPFAQSLIQTVSLQHQAVQRYRQQTAQLDVSLMVNQTWKQMRDRAETILSLGDLIEGGHGRPDLIKQASDRLRDMSQVAACLYARFAEVLPAIRLTWAQQLSQYDTPFSLQTLSRLPRWGEIEYIQQRELQTLGNWLYRQINPKNENTVGFINDLVRVCILLASHAPVNQIIAGRVIQDTPVVVGNQVNLAIELAQVNVGMSVLMYAADNQIVARGVVEDLGKGQVAARIVQSLQPNAKLLAHSRVQFTHQQF